ncbi:MAG: hypothetical protein NZ908_03135, partial [Candidatus Micrarchaeota archaeon]|nr:hypothetical protein [Candidatus Micrarchaeota archaeon]
MRYLVFVLLALAGCIDSPTGTEDQSNHTALDPAKEEFNRTYYSTIISIWERLIGGNYLYNATETENQYVYSVEAYVVGDNYSILYRIGRVPDIEVLAYRKNSEELYCIRLLGRFLNCTNSGQLLFTVLRDYGISDIRRYVFRDRVVIDAEERLVKTIVMSKNIQVQKDSDNKYILSYRPIDLNAQEMRVLGVSETSLETTDRVVQKLEMYNTSYRSEILIYPRNNSPPSNITITTEVSFNISDIPPLHIDFDR